MDTSSGTTFGSTAAYSCDAGYSLTGSTERTCGADGMWSLSEPVCEGECCIQYITIEKSYTIHMYLISIAVDCGSLTDPENGQVDISSGTTFGSTATYSCNTGFILNGAANRVCGIDGNWGSIAPTCRKKLTNLYN